ncbi:MAG TPA: hypothetical protein VFB35_08965 [Gaiellaceae bacterium]|nr:hypothetical protein [Gaiellaceae bacterium]
MVLFPIAFVWIVCVVIWALRQTLEPTEGPWRPWRRRGRDPRGGPHGHPARGGGRTRGAGRAQASVPPKGVTAAGRRGR